MRKVTLVPEKISCKMRLLYDAVQCSFPQTMSSCLFVLDICCTPVLENIVSCFLAGMCDARRRGQVAVLHQHTVSTVSRQVVSWCCRTGTAGVAVWVQLAFLCGYSWCYCASTHQPSEALCWLTVPKVGQQVSEHLHCDAMRHAPRECIKGLLPICFCPGLSP